MSLVIANQLENLISILDANDTMKKNMENYKKELISVKNSLTKFSGKTAEKYRENCDVFVGTSSEAGKVPQFLDKLETYNTVMEELAQKTSKLIDRCHYFGQTLQDDSFKLDYSDGLESGHHVFYDDYVDSIKTDCDKCLEYDEEELDRVDKAESWLEGASFPDGYSNPISGIKATMSQYILEQDRISNFKFSISRYALNSVALSSYVKGKFAAMSDSNYQNFPKPSGMGATDPIKEKLRNNYEDVKLYSVYLQGEEGLAKLQEDCENYHAKISLYSDEERAAYARGFTLAFGYFAEKADGVFEQDKIQLCLDGMGIVATWMIPFDQDQINNLSNNLYDNQNIARGLLAEIAEKKNAGVDSITFDLDKAGISATAHVNGVFGSEKTYNVAFYTDYNRSLDYIDFMIKNVPGYADHTMNDLGYSKDELAQMLTFADNPVDMNVLDALVNTSDDYTTFFAVSCDGASSFCQDVVAEYVIDIWANHNEKVALNEMTTFINSLLNATDGVNTFDNTKEYLELLSVGIGSQNEVERKNLVNCPYDEYVNKRLNASNDMFSVFATLYCIYDDDDYEGLDANLAYMEGGDLSFKFNFEKFIHEDAYESNHRRVFSLEVIENRYGETTSFKYDPFEVGLYGKGSGYMHRAQESLSKLEDAIAQKQMTASLNASITAISIFQPEIGAMIKGGTGILSTLVDGVSSGDGFNTINKTVNNSISVYQAANKGINNDFQFGGVTMPNARSTVTCIADYVKDCKTIEEGRIKTYEEAHNEMALSLFNTERDGGSSAIVHPAIIKGIDIWDHQGLSYVYGDNNITNEEVHNAIYNDNGQLEGSVLRSLCINLCGNDLGMTSSYETRDEYLNINCGEYSREQIEDAFDVIINGGQNVDEDNHWSQVAKKNCSNNILYSIPTDLLNACVNAIDQTPLTGEGITDCWEDAYEKLDT